MEIKEIQKAAYTLAASQGYYDAEVKLDVALVDIVAEVGELLNAYKSDRYAQTDDYERVLNKRWFKPTKEKAFEMFVKDSVEDEFADIIIYIASYSQYKGIELSGELEKSWYRNFDNYTFKENAIRFVKNVIKTHHSKNERITIEGKMKFLYVFAREWAMHFGVDIERHIRMKLMYNRSRGYQHKG